MLLLCVNVLQIASGAAMTNKDWMLDLPKPMRHLLSNELERIVSGALLSAIHEHGPITPNMRPSATKRICGQLRGRLRQAMKEED